MLNRTLSRLRSPKFPIFMILFVDVLGLGIIIPVLPLFAQNELHASPIQITLFASLYFTAQFVASPWLGQLSDRYGRRPVLILSQAGTFTALLMTGLAPSLIFLYLARTIDGLTGGNYSVAQAYLSDITDEKNRAQGIGVANAAFSLGFVFGPAFGSLAAALMGPRVPFFFAAGFSACTVLLSYFMLPESLPAERRRKEQADRGDRPKTSRWQILRLPGVGMLMLIGFGTQVAFFSFQSTYVLWAERVLFPGESVQYVQQAVGVILTLVGVFGIATQFWLIGPMVRRFGERPLVVWGNFARGLAWLAMAFLPLVWVTIAVLPLLSVGGGVALPATLALLTYASPPGQRGEVIGLFESVSGLGRILGPIIAGQAFERIAPDAPMAIAGGLMILTFVAALWLYRLPLERSSASPVAAD